MEGIILTKEGKMIYTKDHQTDNPTRHYRTEDGRVYIYNREKRRWILKEEK